MSGEDRMRSRKAHSRGGNVLPALCTVLGTLLIVAVIALCAPITVPAVAGYQVYEVMSGSMEPAIPVGSAVYVKRVDLPTVEVGDVVAYKDSSGVVVHRVTANRTSMGELVTKGDANNVEDLSPVPYDAVIGRVEANIPVLGSFMAIFASVAGKVYLLLTAACGVMLNMVAANMRKRRRVEEESLGLHSQDDGRGSGEEKSSFDFALSAPLSMTEEGASKHAILSEAKDYPRDSSPKRSRVGSVGKKVIVAVLIVVFLGAGGIIAFVNWQYSVSESLYRDATDLYTEDVASAGKAPIAVDFASLKAKNPNVVGWLYCEGTPIDYPVLQGRDNDFYLNHDYTSGFNINGALFVDSDNQFATDSKLVVYGHRMMSDSMFASLSDWSSQEYYDEHPVMWLLTPGQNYKVVLFSGHHTDEHSNLYLQVRQPGDDLDAYLVNARSLSDFQADVKLDSKGRYIMLSTCSYLFDGDRYVLHGMLVPAT